MIPAILSIYAGEKLLYGAGVKLERKPLADQTFRVFFAEPHYLWTADELRAVLNVDGVELAALTIDVKSFQGVRSNENEFLLTFAPEPPSCASPCEGCLMEGAIYRPDGTKIEGFEMSVHPGPNPYVQLTLTNSTITLPAGTYTALLDLGLGPDKTLTVPIPMPAAHSTFKGDFAFQIPLNIMLDGVPPEVARGERIRLRRPKAKDV